MYLKNDKEIALVSYLSIEHKYSFGIKYLTSMANNGHRFITERAFI